MTTTPGVQQGHRGEDLLAGGAAAKCGCASDDFQMALAWPKPARAGPGSVEEERGGEWEVWSVSPWSIGHPDTERSMWLAVGTQVVTMTCWRVLVLSVVSCSFCVCTAELRSRGLFPAAHRVKRGQPAMVNPILQNSIEDTNLLFEILLAGLPVEDEGAFLCVQDEELASMRHTQKLTVICEDVLPRKLTEIRRLAAELAHLQRPLRREDFERIVLTMVYAAHRMANSTGHQRDAWADSFVRLYKGVKKDLTPGPF
ncbi:protein FAM180A-like [Arapaima gigas]